MSHLVAVAYGDVDAAVSGLWELTELGHEHAIEIDDAVIAEHVGGGRITLRGSVRPVAATAPPGGLIALLFLSPFLGRAIGGHTGPLADLGVDHGFLPRLARELPPGGAAVIALVRAYHAGRVLPRVSAFGGRVITSTLSSEAEAQLQEALGAPADPVAATPPSRVLHRPIAPVTPSG